MHTDRVLRMSLSGRPWHARVAGAGVGCGKPAALGGWLQALVLDVLQALRKTRRIAHTQAVMIVIRRRLPGGQRHGALQVEHFLAGFARACLPLQARPCAGMRVPLRFGSTAQHFVQTRLPRPLFWGGKESIIQLGAAHAGAQFFACADVRPGVLQARLIDGLPLHILRPVPEGVFAAHHVTLSLLHLNRWAD